VLVVRRLVEGDEAAFTRALAYETPGPAHKLAMGYARGMAFADYVASLVDAERGVGLPPGFVPHTVLFGFADGEIVGRVSVRHELNEVLRTIGGHAGYVVIAPMRRRGHGTTLLQHGLGHARELTLPRVLITCDDDNVASRRMIEHAGGVLESMHESGAVGKRRYWVELA
jgi:predicted acetyltransferase